MGQRGNFGGACGGWAHGTISPCSPVCYERGEREGAHTADGLHPQRYLLTLHIPWSSSVQPPRIPVYPCASSLMHIPHAPLMHFPGIPCACLCHCASTMLPFCISCASLLHALISVSAGIPYSSPVHPLCILKACRPYASSCTLVVHSPSSPLHPYIVLVHLSCTFMSISCASLFIPCAPIHPICWTSVVHSVYPLHHHLPLAHPLCPLMHLLCMPCTSLLHPFHVPSISLVHPICSHCATSCSTHACLCTLVCPSALVLMHPWCTLMHSQAYLCM